MTKQTNTRQNKRKHILLKTEIEMIQLVLREGAFPRRDYKIELANRLEDLKKSWYKTK